jgi:hypothetical protein
MKTIRLEKIDREIPLPTGNPFLLHAIEESVFNFGDIRYVRTGLKFFLPADFTLRVEMLIHGLQFLGEEKHQPEGDFTLVVLCCGMKVSIGRMQHIAQVHLYEQKHDPVRFAEFTEGKRVIVGGAEQVENPHDIRDAESRT